MKYDLVLAYLLGIGLGATVGVVIVQPAIAQGRQRRGLEVQRAVREALAYDRQMATFQAAQDAERKE